ncbi:hypothetical protein OS493_031422 [Desmophyllum pertusum]|uniref:DUF6589 domain-containing protein n=1 Tax=Desmophyllum pertusum TaxID=174260 RepID=A0A9W9ZYL7_9CNID|nr:hypothetical protein OS493_031422 [Desmophyllum pertusum]
MQLGDWHTGVKILELLFRRFYSGSASDDHCTMFADRNLINRRNVREDPHTAYRADRDFMSLEVTARVVAAAFHVLGLQSRQDKPKNFPIPENLASQSKLHQLQFLHKAAAKIVDDVVIDETMMNGSLEEMVSMQERQEILEEALDAPSALHSSSTPPSKDADDMFNYNAALLSEGLYFLNFVDAVSEGDGGRIIRQYKYLMLLCKADGPHSTKYALESLYQLLLANSLSEKEAEIFVWNRTVKQSRWTWKEYLP